MKRFKLHISILLIIPFLNTACSNRVADDGRVIISGGQPPYHDIERLVLEAGRKLPPGSTMLLLEAAGLAIASKDTDLARRILDTVESPYSNADTTETFSLLKAEWALLEDDHRQAIRLLEDQRFQTLPLDTDIQTRAGRLRADAYLAGRSYLASARELIYINRLVPADEKRANHERIFSTLLRLDADILQQQARQSITQDVRGWLSLAAMTRQFQQDPRRQLNALQDWQRAWPSHPATLLAPASLAMLTQIVAERPDNIALILPLQGDLGSLGRAIRDGYITAHYQFTPDTSLHVYDSTAGDIFDILARAKAAGAEMIIGPLDREKVTAVARRRLDLPVIALNRTLSGETNPKLYQFGLAPEDESFQVAEQVFFEGHTRGLVFAPDNDWGQRNFDAFAEKFIASGGVIVDSVQFTDQSDYSELVKYLLNVDASEKRAANLRRITGERFEFTPRRRQDIDFVFLLANATQARGINPTLAFFYAEDIPVYATSHVHVAADSRVDAIDMNGIRFCDLPWKLTANDATQALVMDTWRAASTGLAAFYALGVDVHRLYPRLRQLKENPNERIVGSTGILALNESNVINRTLMWAQFRDGEAKRMSASDEQPR